MAKVNTRDLVVEILLLVTRDGQYSHIALNQVLGKYQYLDKSDRAFITRVVEGTLERMIELDYITDQFSKEDEACHTGHYQERGLSAEVHGQRS